MKISVTFLFLLMIGSSAIAQKSYKLSTNEFQQHLSANKVQILDVRSAREYQNGHLNRSLQADWNNRVQFADRTLYLDKSKPLYVYCLSGGRSEAAATWLRNEGFKTVYELKGGFNAWRNASKPVEGQPALTQLSPEAFNNSIQSAQVVLVDVGAEWCPPCRQMEPVLAELEKEAGSRYKFVRVDGGNDTDVMKKLGVEGLPVFIIYKNGKETWRRQGLVSKEELLKNL
ncbi:MAG: thioredoxin fold domain-containing protein [Chitinophagaceae bacterium]|nr:thioredoxin fold domain-containing protein [Chitinophagaceae bacterium]